MSLRFVVSVQCNFSLRSAFGGKAVLFEFQRARATSHVQFAGLHIVVLFDCIALTLMSVGTKA